jgi:hypothetical protein
MTPDEHARMIELCAKIKDEQDPDKFNSLIEQLNDLLEQKSDRIQRRRS